MNGGLSTGGSRESIPSLSVTKGKKAPAKGMILAGVVFTLIGLAWMLFFLLAGALLSSFAPPHRMDGAGARLLLFAGPPPVCAFGMLLCALRARFLWRAGKPAHTWDIAALVLCWGFGLGMTVWPVVFMLLDR